MAHGGRERLRVLLCDEPTSNVDRGSDERVMSRLLALRGVTIVVSAHRLQHLRRFERVVLMARGDIAEAGPPEQLLADPTSRLAAMWRASTGASRAAADLG